MKTERLTFGAGRFVIGEAARALRAALHQNSFGVTGTVVEDPGFPSGYIYVTVTGEASNVDAAVRELHRWGAEMAR